MLNHLSPIVKWCTNKMKLNIPQLTLAKFNNNNNNNKQIYSFVYLHDSLWFIVTVFYF